MSEERLYPNSVIGVVADITRNGVGDYVAPKCSVFGINESEYESIAEKFEVRPKYFTKEAHRFFVLSRYVHNFYREYLV